MRIVELFAGIGACSTALKNLGIDLEIVDAVEIDKFAIASFNAIHNTNFETQDITTYNKDLKEIDLITHGSPCQDFSIAGKQAGGDLGSGTRSSLMYETIRIVGQVRPKYILWENVKNVLSKKHKHNFDKYIDTLNTLGYKSYYQVLNAKDYGIPQNRERLFTISIRKDIIKDFKFPEKKELKLRLKDLLEIQVDEKYYLSDKMINFFYKNEQVQRESGNGFKFKVSDGNVIAKAVTTKAGQRMDDNFIKDKCMQIGMLDIKGIDQIKRVYSQEGLSPTLTNMQGGNRQPKIITHEIIQKVKVRKYTVDTQKLIQTLRKAKLETHITNRELSEKLNISPTLTQQKEKILVNNATKKGYDEAVDGDSINLSYPNSKTRRGRVGHQVSQTLQCNDSMGVVNNLKIRKLTPLECWRLMGFSDEDFKKALDIPTSNTQLYKQAGNSIVVNVLEEIFKNLFKGDYIWQK